MQKMTRRAALAAIPAMGATAAVPAMAESLDAELFRLIDDWRRQYEFVGRPDAPVYEDVKDDPEFAGLIAIETAIAGTRPVTIEGFAAKLLILTSFGEFDLDGPAGCLLPEALSICGIAAPPTLRSAPAYLDAEANI